MSIPSDVDACAGYWKAHQESLDIGKLVDPVVIKFLKDFTTAECFSEGGILRSGNLSRWDLFMELSRVNESTPKEKNTFTLRDRMLAVGLHPEKIMKPGSRRLFHQEHDVGVDNYEGIAQIAILKTLTEEEQKQLMVAPKETPRNSESPSTK